VRETKDEVMDKAKDAAQDGAERLVAELKARAAANPLATIAIGAGLAWRLVHRPPIATVLVGLGLIGLARTTPSQRASQPYMGFLDEDPVPERQGSDLASHAEALADAAKEKVQDWSAFFVGIRLGIRAVLSRRGCQVPARRACGGSGRFTSPRIG
jgi:hypothetical protein